MQYREFGNTGIKLSALGFGAMRLPQEEEYAIECIQKSFELGVNYLDTALVYGESEKICAKALKGWRDKVYISTKNPMRDETYDGWWSRLNESLERMEVDCIDFYQIVHCFSWDCYTNFYEKHGRKAVERALDEGLIKHVCFSTHDSPENVIKLLETGEFEGLTVQYNILDRSYGKCIERAGELGLGVVVMGPVGGGRLAKPSEQIMNMIPGEVKSSPEVALRFVLANPNVTTTISGMNSIEMVEENVEVASRDEALSQEEEHAVSEALNEVKRLSELYCTGCDYCMPCPQEVNIPENFRIMNMHRLYGITEHAQGKYDALSNPEKPKRGKKAEECVQCGLCEPKCPQNIPIMDQLAEVAKTFGKKTSDVK